MARCSFWLLLAAGVAGAQVYPGGYPGGGYPGGGYPGGGYPYPGGGYPGGGYPGGVGIPIPGRRGGQPKANPDQPLPNFRGKLKHIDEKTITITMGDDRVMDFRRTGKTKFYKNGDEIKKPKFAVGDQVSVEGPEEADGSMTAVNVYWEKAAATTQTTGSQSPQHSPDKDKAAGVPDTWANNAPQSQPQSSANSDPDRPVLKRAPSAESNAAAPSAAPAAPNAAAPSAAPAPAQPQTTADLGTPPPDPNAPILHRGKPTDSSQQSGPVPYQANPPATPPLGPPPNQQPVESASGAPAPGNPPVLRRGDDDSIPIVNRPIDETDQLIRRATDAALDFTEALPAYVCQEMMARYQSQTQPAHFDPLDILSMTVVYENGKEDYRDLAINGRKTDKSLEDSGGAWSTGEFGTVLIDLFAPATNANFQFQHDDRISGIEAKLYTFDVKRENSHWDVHAMSQTYSPAYRGSVWIDPQTARVLRIEMQARNIPDGFPLDTVESATDYSYVRLGDAKQHLLPVHAENLSCQRGTPYCSKIVIDFRNYHKYEGESTITFGQPQK